MTDNPIIWLKHLDCEVFCCEQYSASTCLILSVKVVNVSYKVFDLDRITSRVNIKNEILYLL